jgi:hypothetical protein
MNIVLMFFAASSLTLPGIATGQELTRAASGTDSIPIAYSTIKANRVGMSSDRPLGEEPLRIRNDTAGSSSHVGARVEHAVIGGVAGTLAGAVIGGGYGAWIDAHATDDAMISATIFLGIVGAIAGLAVGLLAGATWPVK